MRPEIQLQVTEWLRHADVMTRETHAVNRETASTDQIRHVGVFLDASPDELLPGRPPVRDLLPGRSPTESRRAQKTRTPLRANAAADMAAVEPGAADYQTDSGRPSQPSGFRGLIAEVESKSF
jgi:hypothetical protein